MTDKKTVEDLRQTLVTLGITRQEADDIKGKANLYARLTELSETDEDPGDLLDAALDNVEPVEDIPEQLESCDIPKMESPAWSDYVLSCLTKDEMIEKNPTVDGLRRLVRKLLGPIVNSETNILQCPLPENKERATATVTITILRYGETITASGAGDSYYGNTDSPYKNYPVAIAETRAEGRALRKLLGLRKVVAAEEKVSSVDSLENIGADSIGKITQPQIQYLEVTCRDKLGINVRKLINNYFPEAQNIKDVSHAEALELFKVLSSYQSTGVPEDLQGYDTDWKTSLTGE